MIGVANEKENIDEKLNRYRKITEKALEKVEIKVNEKHELYPIAIDFLKMAKDYFADAQFFEKQGKKLTALAAYSYAHAWLDAGVKLGIFNAKGDSNLFVLK